MAEVMRDIKRRMKTVESTEHITNAMRLVSAAKFRRSKIRYDQTVVQLSQITSVMEDLLLQCQQSESRSEEPEPFNQAPVPGASGGGTVLMLLTSSRGLCGGYNSGLVKLAAETLRQCGGPVQICTIGTRGEEFFRRQEQPVLASFPEGPEKMRPQDAKRLADAILSEWREGRTAEILLVGMRYVNTLKQEAEVRRLLPVGGPVEAQTEGTKAEAEAEPDQNRSEQVSNPVESRRNWCEDLEFLPSKEEVLAYLLPKYLQLAIYQAAVEAAVCEHAARRSAMESATDSAHEMMATLSLTYNRARQQAITDELIEIVSGSEALK